MSTTVSNQPPTTPARDKRVSQLRMTSFSTPLRTSSASTRVAPHTKATVDPAVLRDMNDFTKNVSVDKWVETVCGRGKETIDAWEDYFKQISLFDDESIKADLKQFCSASQEIERYAPLSQLLTKVLELAQTSQGNMEGIDGPPPISDISFFPHDNKVMCGSSYHADLAADRKPDILVARASEKEHNTKKGKGVKWSAAIMCVELKFVNKLEDKLKEQRQQRKDHSAQDKADPPPISDPPATPAASNEEVAGLVEDTADLEVTETASTGSKRSRRSQASSSARPSKKSRSCGSGSSNDLARPRGPVMHSTDASTEAQIGGYALEMLSSSYGTRTHAIVVAVRDDLVSFWYFDSSGVVRTCDNESKERLSLLSNFERVAAIFVALAYCSPEQLGAMPVMAIAPPSDAPFTGTFPLGSLKGCSIKAHSESGEVWTVTLRDHIYTQYTLVGRRTIVYSGSASNDPETGVAVKMSLQYKERTSEVKLIKHARNRDVKNLPEILGRADLWMLSDGIRKIFGVDYRDRILRMIVTSLYVPLTEQLAKDPCSLKDMVLQIIQCIHDLRYKAHVLHRDISDGNIMYNVKDGCFILNDFDLAARLRKDGFPINPSDSTHRTGTLPFMAHDLVEAMATAEQTKIIHTVRHDLESVFWVALWCSVYVVEPNLAEQGALTWKERNEFLAKLETGSHDTISSKKIAIILDSGNRRLRNVPFSPSFSAMRGWLNVFRRRLEEGWKADKAWKNRQEDKTRPREKGLKAGEEQEEPTDTWDAKTLKRYEEGHSEITCSKLKEAFDAYENPPPAPESEDSEVDIEEVQEESEDDWSQDE